MENANFGLPSLVTEHINKMNSILARLISVGIKFDDEVQTLLLISSLPDSWSRTVTTVTSSAGPDRFTFEKIRDLVLGEDVRRRSSWKLSSDWLNVVRGKRNIRGSGSKIRRMSHSKTQNLLKCNMLELQGGGTFHKSMPK